MINEMFQQKAGCLALLRKTTVLFHFILLSRPSINEGRKLHTYLGFHIPNIHM